jgi:hypothetical protein
MAGEYVRIAKVESNFQLQLSDKIYHYQNVLSALGTLQRARRAGSRKAARAFFAEAAAVEFFLGREPIDSDDAVDT